MHATATTEQHTLNYTSPPPLPTLCVVLFLHITCAVLIRTQQALHYRQTTEHTIVEECAVTPTTLCSSNIRINAGDNVTPRRLILSCNQLEHKPELLRLRLALTLAEERAISTQGRR